MREEETKQLETLDGGTSLSQSKRNTNSSSTAAAVADTEEQIHDELPITIPSSSDSTAPPSADSNSAEKKEKKARKDAPILSKEKVNDWEKVSDIYNGAEMENYKWSQTITDLDVRLFIPEGTLAKHMKVDIRSDHLRVEIPKPPSQVNTMPKCETLFCTRQCGSRCWFLHKHVPDVHFFFMLLCELVVVCDLMFIMFVCVMTLYH